MTDRSRSMMKLAALGLAAAVTLAFGLVQSRRVRSQSAAVASTPAPKASAGVFQVEPYLQPGDDPAPYAFGCGQCHPTDPAMHIDGVVEVDLSPSAAPANTLKAANRLDAGWEGYDLFTRIAAAGAVARVTEAASLLERARRDAEFSVEHAPRVHAASLRSRLDRLLAGDVFA